MRQIDPRLPPNDPAASVLPPWYEVVRGLRRAAGITQEGWAARLGYGRRTIQRWENGTQPPDAAAATALAELCRELALFRTYRRGSLAGLTIDAGSLDTILADARIERQSGWHGEAPRDDAAAALHNLPRPLGGLVGREWEVDELARLLASASLVTITGTGGVGKTRLSLEVASRSLPAFPDGACFVPLADVSDPALVSLAASQALRVREAPGLTPDESFLRNIRDRRMVIVLDNCEHIRDGVAEFAAEVLATCVGVHVLATSRDRLGLPGEITWPLAPLITPPDAAEWTERAVGDSDAVRLFVERATAVQPTFRLTDANASDVARITRRLDGLPLAIELAAARMSLLTPTELEARLSDQLELLASSSSVVPARQRTLTATLDWSWGLLADDERRLLAELSVFVDGWDLDGLAAVCPDGCLKALGRLVELSLVTARADKTGATTRYHLLETVRAYASGKLEETGEEGVLQDRIARWCVDMAGRAGRALHGPDQGRCFAWIEAEHASIRSVMSRALEGGNATTATDLIAALWWGWGALGRGSEARAWAERALAADGTAPAASVPAVTRTQLAAAAFASFAGDADGAKGHLTEAESMARGSGDSEAIAFVKAQRVRLLEVTGQFAEAAVLADEALQWAMQAGDGWTAARMLEVRAHDALRLGRTVQARSFLLDAERLERLEEDVWGVATVLAELGDLDRAEGEFDVARNRYEESLALRESLGLPGSTPSLVQNLGFVALAAGNANEASVRFVRAANEFRRMGDSRGVAECLVGMAGVAALQGASIEAARLLGWARHSLEGSGAEIWPSNRSDRDRIESTVRRSLDRVSWRQARQQGASISLADAVALATRIEEGHSAPWST